MIDQELAERFVRSKVLLQEKLARVGEMPGTPEIESQMMFVETRLKAQIKQSMIHSTEEMSALRFILIEVSKGEGKGK